MARLAVILTTGDYPGDFVFRRSATAVGSSRLGRPGIDAEPGGARTASDPSSGIARTTTRAGPSVIGIAEPTAAINVVNGSGTFGRTATR